MKNRFLVFCSMVSIIYMISGCSKKPETAETTLKDAFSGKFLIGTALCNKQLIGEDSVSVNIAVKHFNAVTAENDMKWERIHPLPNQYFFDVADKLIEFGQKNKAFIVGHTLVWHSQTPNWVFEDENGNLTTRDTLLKRMKEHIFTVVGHYRGKVNGWDVVNEAVKDDGSLRQSKWMQIIGEDYIQKAFEYAHQADSSAELYYNDYSMTNELKRKAVIQLVNNLKSKGIKIDGIGMQAHYSLDYPDMNEFEQSIVDYASTGAQVMLTELDVSVLPFPTAKQSAEISMQFELSDELNPYSKELPDSVENTFIHQYSNLFKVCIKHHDKISRVSFWGVNDGQSWKNYWPVPGRTDYPLLFDRNNNPKKVVNAIIELVEI